MLSNRVLIETAIVAALLCLCCLSCKNLIGNDKALEDEVKQNVRLIALALERYATDNYGAYPRYIWGGDRKGWDAYYGPSEVRGAQTEIVLVCQLND